MQRMNQETNFSSLQFFGPIFRFLSPSWGHRNLILSRSPLLTLHWNMRPRTLAHEQILLASWQVSAVGSRSDLHTEGVDISVKNTRETGFGGQVEVIWFMPGAQTRVLECHTLEETKSDLPVADMLGISEVEEETKSRTVANLSVCPYQCAVTCTLMIDWRQEIDARRRSALHCVRSSTECLQL